MKKILRSLGHFKPLGFYRRRLWPYGSLPRVFAPLIGAHGGRGADLFRHLVVVALAQTHFWQSARGQIEYNLTHLRQGVRRIIQALEA